MKIGVGISVIAAFLIGASIAWSTQRAPAQPPVTAVGQPITLVGTGANQLVEFEKRAGRQLSVRLIRETAGRAAYRLGGAASCFAVGPAAAEGRNRFFGTIACSDDFASGSEPILNLSVFHRTREHPRPHYWRVEGIAVDGIRSIRAVDAIDRLIVEIPVVNNVFFADGLAPGTAVKLEAFNSDGSLAYEQELPAE